MDDIYGDLAVAKPVAKAATAQSAPKETRRIGSGIVVAVDALSARLKATADAVSRPQAKAISALETNFDNGLVVEGGEIINDYSESFDALREELLADDTRRKTSVSSSVARVIRCGAEPKEEDFAAKDDEEDDVDVQLEPARLCATGNSAPATSSQAIRPYSAPCTSSSCHAKQSVPSFTLAGSTERFVLVGGLPLSFTEEALRGQAEQFGRVRCIRLLEDLRTGEFVGIALLEFEDRDVWEKAVGPQGFATLPVWKSTGVQPRMVLISKELFGKLRAGIKPWPDGGPCQADLRAILMRQFDMSHLPSAQPTNQAPVAVTNGNWICPACNNDNYPHRQICNRCGRNKLGDGNRPSPEPQREDPADWKDKLKQLRSGVNKRLSSEQLTAEPQPADSAAWAMRLNALKSGVNRRPSMEALEPDIKRMR